MNKRKIKKLIRRIKNIPFGIDFIRYSFNKLRFLYYKAIKSNKVAYPSTIMLELSGHCNLNCTICPREYEYGLAMNKGYMNVGEAKRILDEVLPYLDSIGLTGMGETFLYKDIVEIVDYIRAKNKGVIISLSTNAMAKDAILFASKIAGKVDTIQISVDGVGDVYNSIRIGSKYDQFIQKVKELTLLTKQTSTDLMFNVVVTKENFHQMAELVDLAKNLGIKYINFNSFNLATVTNIPVEYYNFYHSDEFKKALNEALEKASKYPELEMTTWDFNHKNGFKSCPFPWSHYPISWEGEVVPCCAKPFAKELSFGNVKEHKLISILNNNSFIEWRKMWRKNQTPDFCKKCHFIDLKPFE